MARFFPASGGRAAGRCRRLVFYCRWRRAEACGGVCRCASQLARETPSPLRRRGSVVCAWPSLSRHLSPARARAALSRAPVALANPPIHSSSGSERRRLARRRTSPEFLTGFEPRTCGAGEMVRAPTKFTWLDLDPYVSPGEILCGTSVRLFAGRFVISREISRTPGNTKTKICKVTMVIRHVCVLLPKRQIQTDPLVGHWARIIFG